MPAVCQNTVRARNLVLGPQKIKKLLKLQRNLTFSR